MCIKVGWWNNSILWCTVEKTPTENVMNKENCALKLVGEIIFGWVLYQTYTASVLDWHSFLNSIHQQYVPDTNVIVDDHRLNISNQSKPFFALLQLAASILNCHSAVNVTSLNNDRKNRITDCCFPLVQSICTEAYRVTPHYTKDNEYHLGTHAGAFILSVSFVKVLIALAVMNK